MAFGSSEIPADSTKKRNIVYQESRRSVTLTYGEKEILCRQLTEGKGKPKGVIASKHCFTLLKLVICIHWWIFCVN